MGNAAAGGACPERSFRCSGAQLDYCDGTTWLPWQLCASATLCESEPAGRCLAPACTIGQRRCNGAALEGCNVDGTGWLPLETCESAAYCDAISGCGVEPCQQGQSRCNDSLVEVCRSDGLGWDFVERCASGGKKLVLDLAGVDYISSAGLRCFMLAEKQAKSQGGTIVVASMQPVVKEIFEISRFTLVFATFATVRDAVAKLSPAALKALEADA